VEALAGAVSVAASWVGSNCHWVFRDGLGGTGGFDEAIHNVAGEAVDIVVAWVSLSTVNGVHHKGGLECTYLNREASVRTLAGLVSPAACRQCAAALADDPVANPGDASSGRQAVGSDTR
jgi:hypothetical protein